jgi:hypothetical protein
MSSSSDVDDPLPPDRGLRKVGAVFAAVVLLVVAAAIVIPTVEAGAKAPSGLTAAAAASTVRQFVDQAVVQGDGYTALLGVTTASDITGLDLHTTVHGTTAVVTASAPGGAPVAFTLAPATAADQSAYGAPDAPWRIADGAERVVTGGT